MLYFRPSLRLPFSGALALFIHLPGSRPGRSALTDSLNAKVFSPPKSIRGKQPRNTQ
ncbi:hypothetical protein V565_249780 [Rhizoctonia solani 123E]|uniref:Uncharacterized protein n=1 Tax=Rhizoctonia solani 123E TaxID=1423351 RepID=A0A074RG02_9AGAM|nr:hypothetical protein V565_249780 [Rhizoctonia solani 123E]